MGNVVKGKEVKHRNRRMAALLAITAVGVLGAHKFYIGNKKAGVIHIAALFAAGLLANIVGIMLPIALVAVFSCIEGIIYALKSNEQFDEQYVCGRGAFL